MRHRTARRLAGSAVAVLAALMVLPSSAFAIDFAVNLGVGSIVEGDELPAGRLARVSIDIPPQGPPSTATCLPFVEAHNATVDWGDGTSDTLSKNNVRGGGASGPGSGVCLFDVRAPAHTFARARPTAHVVTVTVSGGGASVPRSANLLVTEAEVAGEAALLDGVAGQAIAAEVGTIRDRNRLSTADQFSATMDWGDGSSSPVTLTGDSGRISALGTHTYAAAGNYQLLLRVVHAGQTIVLNPGEARVSAPAGPAAGAAAAPTTQTAASLNAGLRTSLRIVGSRFRRGALRSQGVRLQVGLAAFAGQTLRLELRGASRPGGTVRTLGTQTLQIKGARIVDARRRVVEIRWRCAARLLRQMRAGGRYALRIRFAGGGTVQDTLTLRR